MRKIPYELILFFNAGYKPKELIEEFSYNKTTVYRYKKYFAEALEKFRSKRKK